MVSDEVFERRLRELEKPEYNIKGATDDDMENDSKNKSKSTDSWMDLYRPKNYLDLLSEENVNRTLLHWLKLWDKAVFNREVKIKVPKIDENIKPKWAQGQKNTGPQGRFDKKFEHKKKFFNKNTDGELKEELDSSGRPIQKIVLISGPPGLGKTTLAHVVAKHSGNYCRATFACWRTDKYNYCMTKIGYYPVEMNASDDRNVEAFKLQIEAATQMRSVMGANPLPNCLIIDEIDGAPAVNI